MKAAIVEKPDVLVVRDIPAPQAGDYDALCELLYGATCTGTDQHLIHGRFPWPVHYPTVLGHESIGRVVAVGSKVRNFRVGDLVTRVGTPPPPGTGLDVNWGGYAEYGIARDHWAMQEDGLPAEQWQGYRVNQALPADFDPAGATMMITWRETLSFTTRLLHTRPAGETSTFTALVIGSGGNGLAFAAHARNAGAPRVAVLGSAERAATAQAVGATHTYDYRAEDAIAQLARDFTRGFDVIIDAVGKAGLLDQALPLLAPGGTASIYGIDEWGKGMINPQRARGTFTFYNGGYDEAETHAQVVALVQQGKLQAKHWLDLEHPYALEDIHQAFQALRERRMVKAVIRLHP
jgi:L-iditol 2-dehydrogenase